MTRDELIEFLVESLGADGEDITDDDEPLFSSGMLDSFGLVDLLAHLEEKGSFRINPMDVSLDHLDSVSKILSFFKRQAKV